MTGPTGATPSQQTANPKAGGSKDVPKNDDKQGAKQAKSKKELQETITNAGAANENDGQAMFNVYLFDSVSKSSQMEKFVSIGSLKNIESATLAEIRKSLISEDALAWRQKSSQFCNNEGAEVDDKLGFDKYLDFLKSNEESKGDNDNDSSGKKAKGNNGQAITRDSDNGKDKTYTVYLKSRKFPIGLDEATKELLKKELDLKMAKPETLTAELNKLSSTYNHKDFMALAGKEVTHPADMGEKEWYIVLQNNSVLHGNYVRQLANGQRKVERAMYPAFALKARKFYDYEVVFNTGDGGIKGGTGTATDPITHSMRIPRFLVQDDSYITVSENKSSVADAIADSSLSENSAEVSVGGGAFGVTAGVKVGYKMSDSTAKAENSAKDTKRMTITYNFPRVVLELDGESLDLSTECKNDLATVNSAAGVRYFRRKYGTFFATRIELGGRLHSSEITESVAEAKKEEKAKSLKISAAASFTSAYAQGSASGSYGTANTNNTNHQNSSMNSSMSWEAKGGDTLLCNNPPAWCSTVSSYYNWRISKQDDILSIEDMIDILPDYKGTKAKFDGFLPAEKDAVPKTATPLPQEWDGEQTFWLKHPNELLYPTLVDDNSSLESRLPPNMTPTQAEQAQKSINLYSSPHLFKMMEGKDDDRLSQTFKAGYKFFIVHDKTTNTLKYRFKAGHKYIIKNDKANMYVGATPPVPGVSERSILKTASWADCAYFRFTQVFEADKVCIENRDFVRVEIFDSAGNSFGFLKDIGSLGSYGTQGDIFVFRYKNEP